MSVPFVKAMLLPLLWCALACGARSTTGGAALPSPATPTPAVTLPDGSNVVVEVVSEPESRALGLMFRSSLSDDRGMLFIFPESGVNPFWMKNTLIPLDILWIDAAGTIVHVAHEVPPCGADPCPSYTPKGAATYVLELAAGQAAARGLKEGDRVVIGGVENIVAR